MLISSPTQLHSTVISTSTGSRVSRNSPKTYDGATGLSGAQVTLGNLVGGQALSYTGATASAAHVTSPNKYITAITLADGTGGLASNYQLPTLNVSNAPVTIQPAPLTPTLTNTGVSKTYDGTTTAPNGFTPTFSFTGLVSGDTAATLTYTNVSYNDKDVADANKVTLNIQWIDAITGNNNSAASDYSLTTAYGEVAASINKAHLTVTADNQSRVYGDANPTLTSTLTGFVGGETLASSGVSGSGSATTAATASTSVGSATITAGVGTLAAANYDFSNLTNGTLTITQRPITVNADAKSKTYGDSDPSLTWQLADGSSLVNGDSLNGALSRAAGENAGNYAIGQNSLANSNYAISFNGADLVISPKAVLELVRNTAQVLNTSVDAEPTPLAAIAAQPVASTGMPAEIDTNSGLRFVEVATPASADTPPPAIHQGGIDASGFMRVLVVRGGIALPTQAQGMNSPFNAPAELDKTLRPAGI